jgi:hypothetical protein
MKSSIDQPEYSTKTKNKKQKKKQRACSYCITISQYIKQMREMIERERERSNKCMIVASGCNK